MRLHHLSVTAFGPFAGTEQVDFDELADAGLFLLTGPTGAGKSSLLDAVCFALYGVVPGARGVKALKSQHAAADARPEVGLDFTVQGRRFVVRRSPEWSRPKRRGTGLVMEKASATLVETTGGTEHFWSSRAADVGGVVGSLMGMTAGQFLQVAMLPQGGFQTFLRASSQDRHEVLQGLFRTGRFTRIEHWVDEHGRRLRDRAAGGEREVRRLLHTLSDRSGTPVPDDLDGDRLPRAAAEGRLEPWVADLVTEAGSGLPALRGHDAAARAAVREAREALEDGRRRAEQRRRVQQAHRVLEGLAGSEPDAALDRARLDADERAGRCGPVLELREEARRRHEEARMRRDLELAALGLSDAAPVEAEVELERERVARLEAVLPREREAVRLSDGLAAVREALEEAESALATQTERAERLPERLRSRDEELADASRCASRLEAWRLERRAARGALEAATELAALLPRLAGLDDVRRDARDAVQDARERVQSLAQRRLDGMAAELAGALADGAACQVCGSTEHPAPATTATGPVTDADQQAADALLAGCSTALESAEEAARAARARSESLRAAAGDGSVADCEARVAETDAGLAGAQAAAARRDRLVVELAALRQEQERATHRRTHVTAEVAALRESLHAHERELTAAQAQVTDALAGAAGTSLAQAVTQARRRRDRLGALAEAVRAVAEAEAARSDLDDRAAAAALGQGFGTAEEVGAALLEPGERLRLRRAVEERAEAVSRARAVLADDGHEASDDPVPDLDDLAAAVRVADAAADEAARAVALAEERAAVLERQRDELAAAVRGWAPLRNEALRAESMSRLVRGLGHDNQLQMRLSAYVLATRLDQVVAAANERLAQMRDQRYLLQRTGRAERRGARAGLGLEVVDQWTGDVRAPSTLSGGETFVVSLALALGLADVVTHEAGGTEVETLFVDEGFGSLDADTLDDVMDRLDGLRAGGRTVGVVSHVTELRSRIATQVQVEKGRSGSTVRVRTLAG